jgi:hypothetical protein
MIRLTLRLAIALAIVVTLVQHARAELKVLGNFDDWDAAVSTEGKTKVCYVSSRPEKSAGDYKKRGKPSVLVAHWPGKKQWNVVTVNAGYKYKAKSEVVLKIGNKDFRLFTDGESAWAYKGDDAKIARAMKAGASMQVIGISSRGTRTRDVYSLKGITKAIAAIDKECRHGKSSARKRRRRSHAKRRH